MEAASAARDSASYLADRAGKTIFQTIEQNPLVVAGVGLLLGGLIASALPRSNIEDDLVGDASNAVKQRVKDAASLGFEAATNAAGQVYDEVTHSAKAEDTTTDGIAKATQDSGDRIRRVADSAVTTAFEPEPDNPQPRSRGVTDHG